MVNALFFKQSRKEFHAVGPAQEKARLPYVESRHLGTSSWPRVAECSCDNCVKERYSMLRVCRHSSNEYGGAMSCRHLPWCRLWTCHALMLANVGHYTTNACQPTVELVSVRYDSRRAIPRIPKLRWSCNTSSSWSTVSKAAVKPSRHSDVHGQQPAAGR